MLGVSLFMSMGVCLLWLRSYAVADALYWRSVLNEKPSLVKAYSIRSARGCIEGIITTDHVYVPSDARLLGGMAHEVQVSPQHPKDVVIKTGWRRASAGFGVMHDREYPPSIATHLYNIQFLGQLFISKPMGWTESLRAAWVPHWLLVLAFGAWPMRRIYLWERSRRRKKRGLCVSCGYDMRGGGEKCPECGRTIANSTGEAPVPQ